MHIFLLRTYFMLFTYSISHFLHTFHVVYAHILCCLRMYLMYFTHIFHIAYLCILHMYFMFFTNIFNVIYAHTSRCFGMHLTYVFYVVYVHILKKCMHIFHVAKRCILRAYFMLFTSSISLFTYFSQHHHLLNQTTVLLPKS